MLLEQCCLLVRVSLKRKRPYNQVRKLYLFNSVSTSWERGLCSHGTHFFEMYSWLQLASTHWTKDASACSTETYDTSKLLPAAINVTQMSANQRNSMHSKHLQIHFIDDFTVRLPNKGLSIRAGPTLNQTTNFLSHVQSDSNKPQSQFPPEPWLMWLKEPSWPPLPCLTFRGEQNRPKLLKQTWSYQAVG